MFSKVKNILNSIIKKQNPIPDLIIIVLPVKKMVYNIFIENAGNRNFIISSSSHRMQFGVAMIAGKLLINQRAKINTHPKKKNQEAIVDFENIPDNVENILNGKIIQGEIRLAVKILMNQFLD